MRFLLSLTLLFPPALSHGHGEIRPALGSAAEQYLSDRIPVSEVVRLVREEKEKSRFTEEERLYLEDLTARLPEAVRAELCPSFEKGLCEEAPHFKIWDEVPRLPPPAPFSENEGSWLSKNGSWVAAVLIGGLGLSAAASLRNKEIQIGSGFR